MKLIFQSLRQAAQVTRRKLARIFLHWRLRGRSLQEILSEERKLRGKEQADTLRQADIVIVSFGKSGRTWLRVMLSHLFRVMYRLPENAVMGFDNFHNLNAAVPKVFFTHDNYIKDFADEFDSKESFYKKRVVLLARDPRDVAVSQFFQWKFRMKPAKLAINDYPPRDADISLYDFVTGDNGGGSMNAVSKFLNLWAREASNVDHLHMMRYEDLRATPKFELRRLLDFMQVDASDADVEAAVEYSSYENMKKMEGSSQFRLSGDRLKPGDKGNPDSFKVRRAKVGGYRDYFDDQQVAAIDQQLADTLAPVFKYTASTAAE